MTPTDKPDPTSGFPSQGSQTNKLATPSETKSTEMRNPVDPVQAKLDANKQESKFIADASRPKDVVTPTPTNPHGLAATDQQYPSEDLRTTTGQTALPNRLHPHPDSASGVLQAAARDKADRTGRTENINPHDRPGITQVGRTALPVERLPKTVGTEKEIKEVSKKLADTVEKFGGLEGNIPLTDPYWGLKNELRSLYISY